jgi:glutamyl-tRNA synthetase
VSVKVRFAPSPTGTLHIGSARTALFNWLFAKHYDGDFLLRIEDTDKLRSTVENTESIFEILRWLKIDWNDEPVIQSSRIERHKEVAKNLVEKGAAYYCYCSQEELTAKKEDALKFGKSYQYDRTCRDRNDKVDGINPVIRLKTECSGNTMVNDLVQGEVTIQNLQLDDLILLRSDGTPTYMLSVVVDDHDMEITHVIRGDDHLTNTFRQIQIYKACHWSIPEFGHIPLIYGSDGAKLSKRHGAVSTNDYKDLGYLPEAISNYLLRLGWSHGNDEVISKQQAIEWFTLDNVGKSPSRFDTQKLRSLNSHYMIEMDNESLLEYTLPFFKREIDEDQRYRILRGMNGIKMRAKTVVELADLANIYIVAPSNFDDSCKKYATKQHLELLNDVVTIIESATPLLEENLCKCAKDLAEKKNVKLVEIAQAIRGALCGKLISPSVFEIIEILGKEESILRINKFITHFR